MRLQPQIKNNFGLLQYNFYEDKEQHMNSECKIQNRWREAVLTSVCRPQWTPFEAMGSFVVPENL
ncbi:hypothetical protein EYF80_042783 [Liparis tanakae]|uniref:Uncharacterized protein n=1 Tax=Liparis tanakae TaxID=230148 RepID=A0A4Z2G394_9TELE|nr:hypothetical protein EYF80_042783 [Liparis tanakae]